MARSEHLGQNDNIVSPMTMSAAFLSWALLSLSAWGSEPSAARAASPLPEEAAAGPASPGKDRDFDDFETEFGASTATAAGTKKVFDPLIGYNRLMFAFNDKFYFWLAKPMCKGYAFILPEPGRKAIRRAFHNFFFPLRFVNNLLQFKLKGCATETGRFVVNSSVGIGGLFDPAEHWLRWQPRDEDLGQTLGFYGVGEGVPIVLPLLGQSNLRDGAAMGLSFLGNPLTYLANFEDGVAVTVGERFNYLSLHTVDYEIVKKTALDPYTFIRNGYKEMRKKEITQ